MTRMGFEPTTSTGFEPTTPCTMILYSTDSATEIDIHNEVCRGCISSNLRLAGAKP